MAKKGETYRNIEYRFLPGSAKKVRGKRDAAMFALMSGCLIRASELVAVSLKDVHKKSDRSGRLHIPRSKTDQEGATLYIGPQTMHRVDVWMDCVTKQLGSQSDSAPLFRSLHRGGHIQNFGISTRSVRKKHQGIFERSRIGWSGEWAFVSGGNSPKPGAEGGNAPPNADGGAMEISSEARFVLPERDCRTWTVTTLLYPDKQPQKVNAHDQK